MSGEDAVWITGVGAATPLGHAFGPIAAHPTSTRMPAPASAPAGRRSRAARSRAA